MTSFVEEIYSSCRQ